MKTPGETEGLKPGEAQPGQESEPGIGAPGALTGAQKKYLRGLAHGLKPVVRVGRGGLTGSLLASLDQALDSHELVKVKFSDFRHRKRELAAQAAGRVGCAQVGAIGHVVIFYRPARDPEKRKIELPGAR